MSELVERLVMEAGFDAAPDGHIYHPGTADERPLDEFLQRFAALLAEECAKVCEEKRDSILAVQSGKDGDPVDTNLRMTAWLGANPCAEAIRAKFGG